MNAVRSNNVSLKYQRFTSLGYKVIGFTKIGFVAKSQFLSHMYLRSSETDQSLQYFLFGINPSYSKVFIVYFEASCTILRKCRVFDNSIKNGGFLMVLGVPCKHEKNS